MKLNFKYMLVLALSGALQGGILPVARAQMPDWEWPENSEKTSPTPPTNDLQNAFIEAASKIRSSVVTVYAERAKGENLPRNFANGDGTGKAIPSDNDDASLGSGMVIDDNGHILTNYHVVKDALAIRVVGGSSEGNVRHRPLAKLIGYDEESDLAILQIPPSSDYKPVEFGDSSTMRIGEWVMAIGAPFDQAQTVTAGVISAKGRHLTKNGELSSQDYLQTDASINPGNSGGPLINLQGKVIGINTAILSPAHYGVGIGFAVPSNTIKQLLPRLLEGKQVERGFLGIRYLPLSPAVASAFGIAGGMEVGGLSQKEGVPYGPAFDAGLRKGDVITAINGQYIFSSAEFRNFVSQFTPGSVVQLDVLRPLKRGAQHRTFEITLGSRETNTPIPATQVTPELNLPRSGMNVQNTRDLTAEQRNILGLSHLLDASNEVIITHVQPGAPADDAELQQGQIIERINIIRRSVTGEEAMGDWMDVISKGQLIEVTHNLPAQTKILLQLKDKQGILLYKVLVVSQSPAK